MPGFAGRRRPVACSAATHEANIDEPTENPTLIACRVPPGADAERRTGSVGRRWHDRAMVSRRSRTWTRRSGGTLIAVLLAALLVLAACSSTVSGTGTVAEVPTAGGGITASPGTTTQARPSPSQPSSSTPSTSGSATGAPVPPGLESFYSQQLSWGPCASYAASEEQQKYYRAAALQCARLTVPLSYDKPDGDTITIGVLRKPATDRAQRIGSVIINPGGPGVSGMDYVGQLSALGVGRDLNKEFDLVGFDPRGTGASEPIVKCQTDAERDASRARVYRTRTKAEVDAANADVKQIARHCVERSGAEQGIDGATFLANIGTRDVARDMDVLRAAVGDEKLTFFGGSYGTRLGTVYAEQFPANVRAMILDGAVAPDADPVAEQIGQAKGFQSAFDDFAAWCAGQDVCVLGKDPTAATAVYQSLVRPLLDKPLALSDGRVLSFNDANTGTIQALYSDALRAPLASALLDLSKGNGAALMALADFYDERDAQGHYSASGDALQAVLCMDEPRITGRAARDDLAAKYAAAAPAFDSGDPPKGLMDRCAFWPAKPTLTPHQPDIKGLPTVLVISTSKDPATPYQSGVDLAKALKARLLTVEGTRHGAYLGAGLACVDSIGTRYLTTLELPDPDTTCQ